jgi:hypothetical protein
MFVDKLLNRKHGSTKQEVTGRYKTTHNEQNITVFWDAAPCSLVKPVLTASINRA